jgi:cysteine synthase B
MGAVTNSTVWSEGLQQLDGRIGRTPLYKITRIGSRTGVSIVAKLEWKQFGGSVKSRPAFQIIVDGIDSGQLQPGQTLLDASSGNTAIAYAAIGNHLGLPVEICLPANASAERKRLLQSLGASVRLTSPLGTTDEAQQVARELKEANPDKYFYADQYNNPSNWRAHYLHTAREIWNQTGGNVTHLVTGLGTTGSFMGIGRRLKELNPAIRLIALQPESALHGLEGWKHLETARAPGIYDPDLADEVLTIDSDHAMQTLVRAARTEGLRLSPSSAANLTGASKVAERLDHGVVVTLFPDDGTKYGEVYETLFQ